jgi:hypothetical protein
MRKRAAKLYTKKQQEDNSAAQQVRMILVCENGCVCMRDCQLIWSTFHECAALLTKRAVRACVFFGGGGVFQQRQMSLQAERQALAGAAEKEATTE